MKVALMNAGKSVQLMAITDDGKAIPGKTLEIAKGERVGAASYEQLSQLRDGEYEMLMDLKYFFISKSEDSSEPMKWYQLMPIGVFMLFIAGVLYIWFQVAEEIGGTARMHVVIALLYEHFGKEGVAIFFGVVGIIAFIIGLSRIGMIGWQPIDKLHLVKMKRTVVLRGILMRGSQGKDFIAPVISSTGGWIPLEHQIDTRTLNQQPVEVKAVVDKSSQPPKLIVKKLKSLRLTEHIWR